MRVKVEQRHIDQGKPLHAWSCPVSLALTSATHGQWGVAHEYATLFRGAGDVLKVPLPAEVGDKIAAFDAGELMEPFEFEFDWPKKESK